MSVHLQYSRLELLERLRDELQRMTGPSGHANSDADPGFRAIRRVRCEELRALIHYIETPLRLPGGAGTVREPEPIGYAPRSVGGARRWQVQLARVSRMEVEEKVRELNAFPGAAPLEVAPIYGAGDGAST